METEAGEEEEEEGIDICRTLSTTNGLRRRIALCFVCHINSRRRLFFFLFSPKPLSFHFIHRIARPRAMSSSTPPHPLFACTHHITLSPPHLLSKLPTNAYQSSPRLISLCLPSDANARTQPPQEGLEVECVRLPNGIERRAKLEYPYEERNTGLQIMMGVLKAQNQNTRFDTPTTHPPPVAVTRDKSDIVTRELRDRKSALRVTKITEIKGKYTGYLHMEQHREWPREMKRHITNTVHAEIAAAKPANRTVEITLQRKIDKQYVQERREKERKLLQKGDQISKEQRSEEIDFDSVDTELRCTHKGAQYTFMLYDEEKHGARVFAHRLVENAATTIPMLQHTIPLVKKWLSSHLLLESFYTEEVVELICLSVMQKVECNDVWTGFNNVLHFFSTFSFATEPVILKNTEVEELNKHVNSKDIPLSEKAVKAAFQNRRKLDPTLCHCAMYLATSRDIESRDWTWDQPSKPILKRTKDLATATLGFLMKNFAALTKAQYKQIFTPDWSQFDTIIYISKSGQRFLRRYVLELQSVYGHTALFFYEMGQGQKIGVMFHPSLWEPRMFKKNIPYPVKQLQVSHSFYIYNLDSHSCAQNNFVCADLDMILQHFAQLGTGIVEKVVPKKKTK